MNKLQLTFKQKLELAQFIIKRNGGAITGSLMLKMRGVDLGREPDDIDIIIESISPKDIELPLFCTKVEEDEDNDGYKVLLRAMYFGNKIEFITVDKVVYEEIRYNYDNYKVAKVENLIEAKEYYLENNTNIEYIEKTKRDLEVIKTYLQNK